MKVYIEGSKEAAINIVRRLGYDNLGDKQLKVVVAFIRGRMWLSHFLPECEKSFCVVGFHID